MLASSGTAVAPQKVRVTRPEWMGFLIGAAVGAAVLVGDVELGTGLALPLALAGALAAGDQATGRLANSRTGVLFLSTWLLLVLATVLFEVGALRTALAGTLIWSIPFFVLAFAGSAGGGDFKFAASLGAMCGWFGVPTAVTGLLVSLVACCVVGLVVARRAWTFDTKLHLGLPLFVGTAATILVATFT